MDQFLWAFMQSGDDHSIHSSRSQGELRQASRDATTAAREVSELKEKLQHLELINRAIWALLRESANLTEDDLLQKVRDFDLEGLTISPKLCSACSRPNSMNRLRCLYCGTDLPRNSAFEAL